MIVHMKYLKIQPLDPLMLRDGRPFDDTPGARAYSRTDVVPSVVSGSIRTMIAKQFSNFGMIPYDLFSSMPVYGPLYVWKGKPFFPVPADLGFYEDENGALQINYTLPRRPSVQQGFLGTWDSGEHEEQLWPGQVLPRMGKVSSVTPAYLSLEWLTRWLTGQLSPDCWTKPLCDWRKLVKEDMLDDAAVEDVHFLPPFVLDERDHIAIESDTRVAKDEALFTTQSVVFPPELDLHARVDVPKGSPWPPALSAIHSLGGKRRLAHFRECEAEGLWECPEEVQKTLSQAKYVRLTLATPAYFAKGWLPRWLDDQLCTNELFAQEVSGEFKMKLLWACVPRWQPVSGWSYKHRAPKAVRRMVPAGSVYFFEVTEGNPGELANHWLSSISDVNRRKDVFDKEDGFGLALWGTWQPDQFSNHKGVKRDA